MKFYGRENEIGELRKIRQFSKTGSRMTVLTGRRRIGKTELVDRALNDGAHPYLRIGRLTSSCKDRYTSTANRPLSPVEL